MFIAPADTHIALRTERDVSFCGVAINILVLADQSLQWLSTSGPSDQSLNGYQHPGPSDQSLNGYQHPGPSGPKPSMAINILGLADHGLLLARVDSFPSSGSGEFDQKLRSARVVLFGANAAAVFENYLLHDGEA
jgi:hypothetical protein